MALAGTILSPLLGGLTGDAHGALTEGGEIFLFLIVTALSQELPPKIFLASFLFGGGM